MVKKLAFLSCLALLLGLVAPNVGRGATLDIKIATGADDMEQYVASGGMSMTSSDIEIPYEDAPISAANAQIIGLRYSLPVPKGAKITKAYVEFTCDETKLGTLPVNLIIEGQLIPNAPAFTSAAFNISNRTTCTKAQVKCSLPTWTAENQKIQTADLSAILQELIDQAGWASGNALVLIISDDKSNPSTGIRGAEAYEGEAAEAPLLHVEVFIGKATKPDPANGAQEVTSPLFQWTAGDGALTHQVYMGTKPELGAADKAGAPIPIAMYFHIPGLTPGVTYYWRVDETAADGTTTAGDVWSFTAMPLTAHFPSPADKATDLKPAGQLKWAAGQSVAGHMLYLSTDKAAVEKGDAKVQVAAGPDPKYDFTGLKPFSTYYWRVDEVGATGQIVAGPVWSFSTVNYLPMNDAAVPLNYNNSAAPFISQVTLTGEKDWTANGVTDLTLQFQGNVPKIQQIEPGKYSITARSGDVWDTTDNFRFFYKELTGDGAIVAKVQSMVRPGTDWAKAGVMIRQSLDPKAAHGFMVPTPNNRRAFQNRPVAGGNSFSAHSAANAIALPLWVKLERVGKQVTAFYSANGVAWTKQPDTENTGGDKSPNPQTVELGATVYVGFAVTSNNAAATTTVVFSDLSTTGTVTDQWQLADIGPAIPGNDPQPIYAAVEDSKGKVAVVNFGDPAATQIAQPWTWKIPLTSFTGVDLKNVAKLYLGAGDMLKPVAGGSGVVTFDKVRVIQPVVLVRGLDVTAPGDNVLGVPNNGNWPATETPWLALDNNVNTKFLHFDGKTGPVGFQVQVMAGATIVTGLTFTTANDAPERDPVSFELSGSNDGLQGPWTLIAKGDIVDFKGTTAWPRLTKNTTPIAFENNVAYKFYQVMFPAVRDPKTANSMQIADVELLNGANIIWVSDAYDEKPDGIPDDQGWIDFLTAQGYKIDYRKGPTPGNGYWRTLDADKIAALNAADLVIVSRNSNSGDYNNGDERTQWNSVTAALILMNPNFTRSSHWKWFNTTTINNAVPVMQPVDPKNPAFVGVTLDAKGQIQALTAGMTSSFPGVQTAGNGTVIATRADTGDVWISQWKAGKEFYTGSGQIPAGSRVCFGGGALEVIPTIGRGELNLTDSGKVVFLNVVDMLLP